MSCKASFESSHWNWKCIWNGNRGNCESFCFSKPGKRKRRAEEVNPKNYQTTWPLHPVTHRESRDDDLWVFIFFKIFFLWSFKSSRNHIFFNVSHSFLHAYRLVHLDRSNTASPADRPYIHAETPKIYTLAICIKYIEKLNVSFLHNLAREDSPFTVRLIFSPVKSLFYRRYSDTPERSFWCWEILFLQN